MKRLLGFLGATVGSSAGWWLGAHVGIGTAVVVSSVGTGFGLWLGIRVFSEYLE